MQSHLLGTATTMLTYLDALTGARKYPNPYITCDCYTDTRGYLLVGTPVQTRTPSSVEIPELEGSVEMERRGGQKRAEEGTKEIRVPPCRQQDGMFRIDTFWYATGNQDCVGPAHRIKGRLVIAPLVETIGG
jgi:hypothetical protein